MAVSADFNITYEQASNNYIYHIFNNVFLIINSITLRLPKYYYLLNRRTLSKASGYNPFLERTRAMVRKITRAAWLTLMFATPALAQPVLVTQQPSPTAPPAISDVEACVAQMHRMAGLNKGLGANYNADRVRRDCAAGVYSNK